MAIATGSATNPLNTHSVDQTEALLAASPWAMCFFQAVRRLEAARRDLPRVGCAPEYSRDVVAFCQNPFFEFPPRDIESYVPGGATSPGRMSSYTFGLLGPMGPLPLFMTDEARQRQRAEDNALVEFLGVLTNRMTALFYRSWVASDQSVSFDRMAMGGPDEAQIIRDDVFLRSILQLGGFPLQNGPDQRDVPVLARAYFAGWMTSSIRNPDGLIAIVSNFFGVPAQIDECVGRWVRLPDQMQCRMSESPRTGTISRSLVMGRRYWDCGSVIRIVLGPLSLDDYMRLLPGGESSRVLRDWVVSYLGPEYECEVQLKLAADQVPRMKFGANRMHLGWNSWFRVGAIREDRGDLIYRLTDPDQSEEVG